MGTGEQGRWEAWSPVASPVERYVNFDHLALEACSQLGHCLTNSRMHSSWLMSYSNGDHACFGFHSGVRAFDGFDPIFVEHTCQRLSGERQIGNVGWSYFDRHSDY